MEILFQALPARVVVALQVRRLERLRCGPDHVACFEHESHRVGHVIRFGRIRRTGLLEARRIRSVPAHAVVQACAAGHETARFRVVRAVHEAHEFARDIAMEPRRTKRMLRDEPARRENHEIQIRNARRIARRGEHGEDRWVRMIETDRSDRVEQSQIVFVRNVIAVPCNDIERRMIDARRPHVSLKLRDQLEFAFGIFERRDRREEISRVGQAIRIDRA